MPELNGVLLCRRLTGEMPELRVLVLTLHEDRAYLNQALEAGARGYMLKRSAVENLVQAIRAVMVGGTYSTRPSPGAFSTVSEPAAIQPHKIKERRRH